MALTNTYSINVDIKRRMTSIVPTFSQGDSAVLKFRVYDNGKLMDMSDYTHSEVTFRQPSGRILTGDAELVNGEVVYTFAGVEMSEIGKLETILSVSSGSSTVSIQPFYCFIFDSMKSNNLEYIGILQELIKEVQGLELGVGSLLNDFNSFDYSPTTTYDFPNLVTYNGSTYIALKAVTGITPIDDKINYRLVVQRGDVAVFEELSNEIRQKSQAANLAYKESYPTLADLQSAYPTGDINNHVILADGMIYTWSNNAWANTQILANGTGLADTSVSPQKTTFFNNKKAIDITFTQGLVLANSNGLPAPGDGYITNYWIEVESNATYFLSNHEKIAFFKEDATLKRMHLAWELSGSLITIDSDVKYIAIQAIYPVNYVFAKSDRILTYEEAHAETLNPDYIPTLNIEKVEHLEDKLSKIDSLINEKPALHIEFTAGYEIANSNGAFAPGNMYVTLTKIPVEPNATYFFSSISKIAFFLSNEDFKSISLNYNNNQIITMPSDVHYIRVSTSNIVDYVFVKSNKALTYEEANTDTIKIEKIPKLPIDKIIGLDVINDLKSYYNEKLAIPVTFTEGTQIANSTGEVVGGGSFTSDLIPVQPSTNYFFSKFAKLAFFDANEDFKYIWLDGQPNSIVPIDDDIRFIRVQVHDDTAKFVLAKSDRAISYEEANSDTLKPEHVPSLPVDKIIGLIEEIQRITGDSAVKNEVACYGDSLTEGTGTSNGSVYSYPARLLELISASNGGYSVVNRGVGGEDTVRIMIRQGSYADYVEPFTIPATTTAVAITKPNFAGANGIKNGVNPVTIKGIEGNLSLSGGTYYFARSVVGNVVVVDRPTPIIRASTKQDKGKIQIFFMGQNGGYADIDELILQYRRMIDFLGHNKYLVIGLTSETATSRAVMEERMEATFGINYINMREYLVRFGLSDNSLTPTQADMAAIENGSVPPQILSDSIHFNNNGYYSIAKAVYARGQELGFWN